MNDSTVILTGHTKKYNIPSSHLEHRYIEHCTDGIELEKIYKELISGEVGSHPILEQLTLNRIRYIQPNSSIFRQDKLPLDKSTSFNDETRQTNDFFSFSTDSASVINNKHKQTVPKSNEAWKKFEQTISREFNSDYENDNNNDEDDKSYEENKRVHKAKQLYLNANTAFKSNNYQQSIDLYTKSIILDKNLMAYINRAISYFQLDNFDASIQDCSYILSIDSKHIKALFHRALCYLAKQQYNEAKCDLDNLLTIDPDNNEAQNLLNKILMIQKTNSTLTTDDNDEVDTQSSTITSLNVQFLDIEEEEEQVNNNTTNFNLDSSSKFDHHNINQFQTSSSNDDEDNMALGDEAGAGLVENLSDDEGHVSHSIDESPTMDDDSDTLELNNQKSSTKQNLKNNLIDQSIAFTNDDNNKQNHFSMTSHNQTNDNYHLPTISNHFSLSSKQNTISDTYMQSTAINDAISNSNFGSTIQSWLRDTVILQSNRRLSSYYDRPWSKSSRPWSLEKIQHDIEKFNRFNNYKNAIEVSKKMLQNGILDYHYYAEYIVETLIVCAECYLKLNNYVNAIQYATEALQYNRMDGNALICRAKAFENEKLFLFSYADYTRVPTSHFNYYVTQRIREKLSTELNSIEGETWREKLLNDQNDDDERYLNYLKIKNKYSENNAYEWYQKYADQLYLDACFVLAIRCYTYCIELQPNITDIYLKRAACYLKVFEPQKVLSDCDIVLKEEKNNLLALYYKASAYKMSRDNRSYELTLKEYIKLQPHNQIVLAEYYTCRHEQIPRKKRRIRTKSIDENNPSYEELEEIRLEKRISNLSLDSNDLKDQCSLILHLPEKNLLESFNLATTRLIEIIINTSRIMIQAEQYYQQEHKSILPFSYIKYCFDILIELTTLPQIDTALSMIDENYRILLNDLLSYYSSIFYDIDKLNRLKNL